MSLSHFLKNRSLRVDILTIFLFLIALSSLSIIVFTYSRTTKSIMEFSEGVIERASEVIIDRIYSLIDDAEDAAREAVSLMTKPEDYSVNNQAVLAYMLQVIQDKDNLYGFYFSRADGSMLEIVDIAATEQTHFLSNPVKLLPKGTCYALRFTDRSGSPPIEIWYYKNESLETTASESIQNPQFDATVRPWYIDAIKAKGKTVWSQVYLYDPLGEPGITVSKALYINGEPIAVVGVDISLHLFSHYITEQKIGKTGKAFILNTEGQVIIPQTIPTTGINQKVIAAAYKEHEKHPERNFLFEVEGIHYLASSHRFPVTGSFDWIILVIAPLKDFLGEVIATQHQVVWISLAIMIFASLLVIYFSKKISIPIVILSKETDHIRHLNFESETRVYSNIREIRLMDESVAAMRLAIRSFGRYIPKEIVMELIDKGKEIDIGGDKREVTILFSDIEGFTTIAESYDTDKLMELLSQYFDGLSKIILKNQGNIDKFIGDGIMALWGAPHDLPDHVQHACRAAIECQAFLSLFNQRLKSEQKPVLSTRIGIDTGEVVVGNVGTAERMNYTAMGNAVNTASRLQSANKIYHTSILISEHVREKLGSEFLVRPLDIVELKGKKEKTKIYELMDKTNSMQVALSDLFTQAFNAYIRQDQAKAYTLFQEIQKKFPSDHPTQIYLGRLKDQL